jgi:hypothetical protein
MRRALTIVLVGIVGCIAGSQGDHALAPEIEGESGGELVSGCGVVAVPGPPVAMDFVHPSVGVSGNDAAKWLAGEHVVAANVWLPWWSAEPSARDPLGPLTIAIEPKGAFDGGAHLHLAARVRVKDASGALLVEQDEALFSVTTRESAYASLDFEAAALATRLGLPPAAQSGQAADAFKLDIGWLRGAFSASLGSVRAGNTCPLWQPKPEPAICERGAGLLVMEDGAVTEPRDVRATLVGDFAPIDAIRELQKQALEVTWPEGTRTRLHVAYEPGDHACVTEGYVHVHASEHHATRAPGFKVVIPLHASLRTDDGRLLLRMSGFAEALIAHEQPWDRRVDAALGYQEGAKLAPGERLGFSVPAGALGFLSGWLRAPMTDSHAPQLTFAVCTPYAGVPPFPAVSESWSNRLGCFCAAEQRAEAPIRLSTTSSP